MRSEGCGKCGADINCCGLLQDLIIIIIMMMMVFIIILRRKRRTRRRKRKRTRTTAIKKSNQKPYLRFLITEDYQPLKKGISNLVA